ncbi:MAG: AraC family transcriptional regulator [Pseudomonadales bacterium]|nr:AraC family transcriptional regulator [Pseudomonadales bacterium]
MNPNFAASVIAYADKNNFSDMPTPMGFGGLSIARARQPSPLTQTLYVPLLCLVLQGKKSTQFGNKEVLFGAKDTLIVSINLPTTSQVTVASPKAPYVSLAIEINLDLIRELQLELEHELIDNKMKKEASVASGIGGTELANAMQRLFLLHQRSYAEQKILSPLIQREIHFRMLFEGHGGMLRQLARPDSHASRINRAILKLHNDYAQPITIQQLATLAGMSVSSFHEHFKTTTALSPLQYLKNIRLHKAQQMLSLSADSVSSIGFEVGYESAAQFSREFARKFGYPPSKYRR